MSLQLAYPVHFFHLFAQTSNLRQWLDRRAGSPGVITSFVFLLTLCRFQQCLCSAALNPRKRAKLVRSMHKRAKLVRSAAGRSLENSSGLTTGVLACQKV